MVKTHNYYTEMFGIPTQPREYLSAPYQMSKVKSTLHQLIRDWSDEVGGYDRVHCRVKKKENFVTHHYYNVFNNTFPLFAMRMVRYLLKISNHSHLSLNY